LIITRNDQRSQTSA